MLVNSRLVDLKSSVTLRILSVAPTLGERVEALKVGKKVVSHLTPLHAPDVGPSEGWKQLRKHWLVGTSL